HSHHEETPCARIYIFTTRTHTPAHGQEVHSQPELIRCACGCPLVDECEKPHLHNLLLLGLAYKYKAGAPYQHQWKAVGEFSSSMRHTRARANTNTHTHGGEQPGDVVPLHKLSSWLDSSTATPHKNGDHVSTPLFAVVW
ncbi:hypothetical protein IscW_ISCW001312, partial [Ixodes scapularis]